VRRGATSLAEVAIAELIGKGNRRRPHRPVFVRTLDPGHTIGVVNPKRESHNAILNRPEAADARQKRRTADRSLSAAQKNQLLI
jgi:hypothetical protein